jgi:hypothetical protein
MPQIKEILQNQTPLPIAVDAGAVWAKLDDVQLESWLGDYIWFSQFGDREYRADCARTCDELLVECALRGRQDCIGRAQARVARTTPRIQ